MPVAGVAGYRASWCPSSCRTRVSTGLIDEHLYTVVFAATELWGDDADHRDEVSLDLWESYLVET